ncbi:hypothetical protein HWV62_7483 [Athelia sp. TMB]|nr:hypothetical protein HWV62_7483 [Athelia sp. TMB]
MTRPTLMRILGLRFFLPYVANWGTPRIRRAIIQRFPLADVQTVCRMVDVMYATSIGIVESKKAALSKGDAAVVEQVGRGKDVMMKANLAVSAKDRLPDDELIGQVSILTLAAMDTTSSALSRILHILAQHPDAQTRLRDEVTAARQSGGDLDYNGLDRLPFLDAVIRESLRLYPPVPVVSRVARQDMILPLSKPMLGVDGKPLTEIFVPKGTITFVSIIRANRDPGIWGPDSYEWKPERWLKPLPDTVIDAHYPAVYANLMTFIGGGRACIGFKFSELEMKVVLSLLLESFSFAETNTEIVWNAGGVMAPVVANDKGEMKSGLPLVVTAVNAA